jgi:hypothetical protein
MISASVLHNYIEKCLPLPRNLFRRRASHPLGSVSHLVLRTHTGKGPIKLLTVQQRTMFKEISILIPLYTLKAL